MEKLGISPQATLSGYVELQYLWPWDPFCATIRNVDSAHSVIFTYGLRATQPLPGIIIDPPPPPPTKVAEGMWWKQEANVTAFVAIANLSSDAAQATVQVTDSQTKTIAQHDLTISPHGMKLITLDELQSVGAAQGGIRVTSSETMDNMVISGGLQDQQTGYSANLPFATDGVQDKPEPATIGEIGLMAGAADPMMQFPAGTSFTPYTFLRNVADTPVTLTATLWWMESGAAHSAQLPSIALQAYETRDMAVPALLGQYGPKNFNGSFNLVFEGEARRGSLVMSSGSVDQTNTYVFEVGPRGIGEGTSKSLQYWSTGNGDDTMVSVWNPADEAQDFAFTLYFKGGHYIFPIHLEGRETRALDISTIIQNQVPDVEGNIIPASVHDGTAKIAGSKAETEVILVAVQAGIYNVRKATCHSICAGCNGYTGAFIDISSFTVTVGGTQQLHLVGIYGSGGQTYIPASWNSTDTNVATVGAGTGLVTGVGPGSVSILVDSGPNQPIYVSWGCDKPETFTCPTARFQLSASGTVLQACPTAVTKASSSTFSLASQFPALKTGIGIGTAMQVSPSTQPNGHNWNGTLITEALVTNINTCPANIGNSCAGSSTFSVGAGAGMVYGINFPATPNTYYDFHATVAPTSLLDAPGAPNSCTSACTQRYSCNGSVIGALTVVRSFTKGKIQGTPVTNVSVTKDPQ